MNGAQSLMFSLILTILIYFVLIPWTVTINYKFPCLDQGDKGGPLEILGGGGGGGRIGEV